jgi:predicted HTH transcriptional regulator
VLLFAENPLRHNVHIGRFKTPSTIIDDRQFTDTLFEVVEQAMKFIVSHIAVAFEFDGSLKAAVPPAPTFFKDSVVRYAVLHGNEQLFASKYKRSLPSKNKQ